MMKQQTIFITGTDTDVGKTLCCKAILQAARSKNISTLAYKPIASDCHWTSEGLRNKDALTLKAHSSITVPYNKINPIRFELPIAPHIAAQLQDQIIDYDELSHGLYELQREHADFLIIEGAGGWRLPLDNNRMLSDWVIDHNIPVILVVGMKLGCLNHAILTYEALQHDGIQVIGWIANQLQKDMPFYCHNVTFLKSKITAPMIAEIPYLQIGEKENLAQYVDLSYLVGK